MAFRWDSWARAKLFTSKGTQGVCMARNINRLGSQPWEEDGWRPRLWGARCSTWTMPCRLVAERF